MIEDLNLEKEIRGLEENEEEDTGVLIMIFFFFILIAGNLLLKLSSLTKIPYPPMLLACCIFFGSLASRLGKLGDALDLCYQISPVLIEMIGLLLLPPIIFESGFQLNWHALRKQMLKVFLLSWIGLLINALLLGVVIRYVFQYQTIFSFSYAFQLGTILSVPEPGLIIPTLQELGVLKSVQQLIASEQLICCASALVLFGVIEQYLEGNKIQIGYYYYFYYQNHLFQVKLFFIGFDWLLVGHFLLQFLELFALFGLLEFLETYSLKSLLSLFFLGWFDFLPNFHSFSLSFFMLVNKQFQNFQGLRAQQFQDFM